jgi:hypothetical protein
VCQLHEVCRASIDGPTASLLLAGLSQGRLSTSSAGPAGGHRPVPAWGSSTSVAPVRRGSLMTELIWDGKYDKDGRPAACAVGMTVGPCC